ncbi:MAG: response regulator transcription factor [Verrucomicrobiota bacterium]
MSSPQVKHPIRLLLVDDHAVIRAGLQSVLNATPGLLVVGSVDDAKSALGVFEQSQPDVTLLDIHMPLVSGIECLRLIRNRYPESKVLMLTSSETEEDIFLALEAGALGYVLKSACPEELISTIHSASQGKRVLSAKIEKRIAERDSTNLLTTRELEVLNFVRKGLSNQEIGDLLQISMHTAKAHVAALLKKLEATDRAEAVARAFERGLLKP